MAGASGAVGIAIVGAIVASGGLVWAGIGVSERRSERRLQARGIRVMGKVVDVRTFPTEDDLQSGSWRIVVEYEADDQTLRVVSREDSPWWDDAIGREFAVVFDPDNPASARLECDLQAGPPIVRHVAAAAIGIALLLAGLLGW